MGFNSGFKGLNPVVAICTTSHHNITTFYVLPTQFVFCMKLRTNSDYFRTPEKLVIVAPLQIHAKSSTVALHLHCRVGLIVVAENVYSGTCVSKANEP
jgi:hypothetical protein